MSNKKYDDNEYVLMNYWDEDLTKISKYIEKHFGKCDYVIHERSSKYIHTDIFVTAPTQEKAFYTLVTVGMGSQKMFSPSPETDNIELVAYLSKEIDLNSEQGKYILQELVNLTKYPFRNETWFEAGHTITIPDINLDYLPFQSFLFTKAKTAGKRRNASVHLPICDSTIKFHEIIPITNDEYEFIVDRGHEQVLKRLEKNSVHYLDKKRDSVFNNI